MIFWTVLAGLGGGIVYDKHEQKKIREKYMKQVEHLGEEVYSTNRVPRRLTIFIAPPPNDFLQESLKHFRRYIKPVLNAAAIDFTVFTEERQGDIRSEVAEKIRQLRRERLAQKVKEEERLKQEAYDRSWTKFFKESVPNAFKGLGRKSDEPEVLVNRQDLYSPKDVLGLYKVLEPIKPERDDSKDIDLSGGVICIGRGTYKEYMAGVHEGLLGPLEAPPPPPPEPKKIEEIVGDTEANPADKDEKSEADEISDFELSIPKDKLAPVPKPYILPSEYANAQLAPELNMNEVIRNDKNVPVLFEQPLAVFIVPKITGMLNIPRKIYRFYTKRTLAESVSNETLTIVDGHSRPFQYKDKYLGGEEELDWPKKWVERGKKKNSEWVQDVEIDERVTSRMRVFEAKK